MKIQWNGEKKSVNYISSIYTRNLIESATKAFNIAIPIEQLYLLTQDQKEVDAKSIIPFSGYPEDCFFLYPKPNLTVDSSDESDTKSEEIFINCEGSEIGRYPYEKKRFIQDYFKEYLTHLGIWEFCKDDTCIATERKHKYDHNSTLADLKIKPNDTLYIIPKDDAKDCIWIHHKAMDKQLDFDYRKEWSVRDYITKVLTVSTITLFHL